MMLFRYMAPEMVAILNRKKQQMKPLMEDLIDEGKCSFDQDLSQPTYSKAVDWWSLGVTMYRLLTGVLPFDDEKLDIMESMCSAVYLQDTNNKHFKHYASLFKEVGK